MIRSLALSNFLSHKHSTLTFCPGVNVIIGPNDAGKTAIVRALRWAVHNKPAGSEFISHWADSVEVTVQFDDCTVTRMRDTQNNSYTLDGVELVGFGQETPTEVAECTLMDERNIQYQFDGPFLLNESAGAVARTLNRIARLDKIDSSLSNTKKLELEARSKLSTITQRLESIETELSGLPDFLWIDSQLAILTDLQTIQKNSEATLKTIETLLKNIAFYTEKLDNIDIPKFDFSELDSQVTLLTQKEEQYKELRSLLSLVESHGEILGRLENEHLLCLNNLKSLCPNLCPLCDQKISPTSFVGAKTVINGVLPENGGEFIVRNNVNTNTTTGQTRRKSQRPKSGTV